MSKRLLLTILLFLLLFTSLTFSAVAFTSEGGITGNVWSPPEQAATFSLIDMERGADGIIHLLGYTGFKPFYELEYAQRDLAGNWSSPETIDDDMGSDRPLVGDLAIGSDGTAHVIYLDNPGGGDHYVEYAQRSPAGTWTIGTPISDPSHDGFAASLLLNDANQPYASWVSFGQPGLYTRYQVGGVWSDIKRVDINHFPAGLIALMDTQQNIHYFWFNYDLSNAVNVRVNYRKQLANNTFEPITPISDPPSASFVTPRGMFASLDGDNPVVIWGLDDGTSNDIFFADFTSGTWNSPVQLNTTAGNYYPIFVGASDSNVYIINGDNDTDTYTYRYRPPGGSWSSEPLNFITADAEIIALVATNNTFHLFWDDDANPIQYRIRQNLGAWSAIEPINSDFFSSRNLIKQQGQFLDLAWGNSDTIWNTMYSYGLLTNIDPQPSEYLPVVIR